MIGRGQPRELYCLLQRVHQRYAIRGCRRRGLTGEITWTSILKDVVFAAVDVKPLIDYDGWVLSALKPGNFHNTCRPRNSSQLCQIQYAKLDPNGHSHNPIFPYASRKKSTDTSMVAFPKHRSNALYLISRNQKNESLQKWEEDIGRTKRIMKVLTQRGPITNPRRGISPAVSVPIGSMAGLVRLWPFGPRHVLPGLN
jgi:hypothetical protein